jgi:hypothetical protein
MKVKSGLVLFGAEMVLSLVLVILSGRYITHYRAITGNVCGNPSGDCVEWLPQAGFPLPYHKDDAGTSVVGRLGPEDRFKFPNLVLDLVFYYILIDWSWLRFMAKKHDTK